MSDTETKPEMPTAEDIESGKVQVVLPEKKKRVKKRFTSKEQIVKQIDKFTKKAKLHREKQRECYVKSGSLRRHYQDVPGFHEEISKAKKLDEEGDRWGRKADRLEKDVLKALSAKLAEFQTDPIPGITDDRSVEGI